MRLQQEKEKENQQDQGSSVIFQAMIMAFGTLSSRILGLVRESLFAALFPRFVTDAWYVAFRLPNVFRRLFGEGSLAVSFIPVFVESRVQDPTGEKSRELVNAFTTLFFILLGCLTTLGVVFPEATLNLFLDSDYSLVPGKFALTVQMARIMFVYVFLVCTYAYFMAILNALGRFGWAALAPTFFNVAMILATLIPKDWQQWQGQALAWGVVVGGVVQAGLLIPHLIKLGYFPRLIWRPRHREVWRVLRQMGPGLVGMSLLQVTTLVNMMFASRLDEGSISYLSLADRLMELPLSLVSVSIGAALLPTLSRQWAEGRKSEMCETGNYYLRLNLFICLPAAVGLYFLASPIVEILFRYGKFTPQEVLVTAGIVQIYSVLVITTSLMRVFVPCFYAMKNTWVPAVASLVGLLLHLFLAPVLMGHWGLRGLNFSSVATTSLNFVLLVLFFRFLVGPFDWGKVLRSFFFFLVPTAAMVGVLLCYPLLREGLGEAWVARVVALSLTLVTAAIVYLAVAYGLKIEECRVTVQGLFSKIKRRLNKNSPAAS